MSTLFGGAERTQRVSQAPECTAICPQIGRQTICPQIGRQAIGGQYAIHDIYENIAYTYYIYYNVCPANRQNHIEQMRCVAVYETWSRNVMVFTMVFF